MGALSANRISNYKGTPTLQRYPVNAASVIYKGALVVIDTDGYLRPAVDTTGFIVVGIATEAVTGGSADGDETCEVMANIVVELAASSIAQTSVPLKVYVVDDQTIDETTPANSVIAGLLVEVTSTTKGWVFIPPYGQTAGL